jgi:hypothetical protein
MIVAPSVTFDQLIFDVSVHADDQLVPSVLFPDGET